MTARIALVVTLGALLLVPASASAITGGGPATRDYPYMAALTDASGEWWGCGASLIRPDWVLTAAHCVAGEQPSAIGVRIGTQDLTDGSGELIPAAQIIVHERYGSDENDAANAFDVALVRLARPSATGTPIRIPAPSEKALWAAGEDAVVTGWGGTFFPGTGGLNTTEDQLHEVGVPMVADDECGSYLYRFDDPTGLTVGKFSAETMVCAGETLGGVDSCNGDSGGPLVVSDGASLVQVGVVSWGFGCGYPLNYGVYGRVADTALYSWIQAHLPATGAGGAVTGPPPGVAPVPAAGAPAPAAAAPASKVARPKKPVVRLTKSQKRCLAKAKRVTSSKKRRAAQRRCLAPAKKRRR